MPGAADALVDGLDRFEDSLDKLLASALGASAESLFDTRLPLVVRSDVLPGADLDVDQLANLPLSAPELRDLLTLPTDLTFDGLEGIDRDEDGTPDDDSFGQAVAAAEAKLAGFDLDMSGEVSFQELFAGVFTEQVRDLVASGLSMGSEKADFVSGLDALDDEIDVTDFGGFDLEVKNVADTSTDQVDSFSMDFELSVTNFLKLDLGLEADELGLSFEDKVGVAATLGFQLDFGVATASAPASVEDFFIEPTKIDFDVEGQLTLNGADLSIGFIGASITGGSVALDAEVDVTLDSNVEDLGFGTDIFGQKQVGEILADFAPASLDEDVTFLLQLGEGIEFFVRVDADSGVPVEDQIRAAVAPALEPLVGVELDAGRLKLFLADTDAEPLGFDNEAIAEDGVLTAADVPSLLDQTTSTTVALLVSVGTAAPRLVRVATTPADDEKDDGMGGSTTGELTLEGLVADINVALSAAGITNVTAGIGDNGTPANANDDVVQLVASGGERLEITRSLTLTPGISYDALDPDSVTDLASAEAVAGSATATLPISVQAGLATPGGGDFADAFGTVNVTFGLDPFDPGSAFDTDSGRFDVALGGNPSDLDRLSAFTEISASDFTGLISQLGGFLGELGNSQFFEALDIPFAEASVANVLDLADLISDAILIDDNDTPDTGDDVAKLLGLDNAPAFVTAQDLIELVGGIGGSLLDGLGITGVVYDENPDGDSATFDPELTFDFAISHQFFGFEFPLDFNLNLEPFLELSSGSAVAISATGDLLFTLGLSLGDVDGGAPLTGGTSLLDLGITTADAPAFRSDVVVAAPDEVNIIVGRLGADATFTVEVDGDAQVIKIEANEDVDVTADNETIADLVDDIQRAIDATSLNGDVVVSADGNRIVLTAPGATSLKVTVADDFDAAVRELGLPAEGTADNSDGDPQIRAGKSAPVIVGRLTEDTTFTVQLDGDTFQVTVSAESTETNTNMLDLLVDVMQALSVASLTTGEVVADFDLASDAVFDLTLDRKDSTTESGSVTVAAGDRATLDELAEDVQAAIDATFGEGVIEVDGRDRKLVLTAVDAGDAEVVGITVTAGNAALGLQAGVKVAVLDDRIEPNAAGNQLLFTRVDGGTAFTIGAAAGNQLGLAVSQTSDRDDFQVVLNDGTTFRVSLDTDTTVGDVIASINAASQAAIGQDIAAINDDPDTTEADGTALLLTDPTVGSGTFRVESVNGSVAAQLLGIERAATDAAPDEIQGDQLAGATLFDRFFIDGAELSGAVSLDPITPIDGLVITAVTASTTTLRSDGFNVTAELLGKTVTVGDAAGFTPGTYTVTAVDADNDTFTLDGVVGAVGAADGTATVEDFAFITANFGFVGVTLAGTGGVSGEVVATLHAPGTPEDSRVTLQQLIDNLDTLGEVVGGKDAMGVATSSPDFHLGAGTNGLALTLDLESDVPGLDNLLPSIPTIDFTVDRLGTGFVESILSDIGAFVLEGDASFVLSLVSGDADLNGTEIAVNLEASATAGNTSLQDLVDDLNQALDDAFQDALGEAKKIEAVIEAGQLKLQAVAGEGVSEFNVATSALNAAATALGFDHALPQVSLPTNLDDLIGNLSLFDDLSFGTILEGLEQLSLFLSQFEAFGFLSDPLPLVDVSVNDLIGVAIRFNTAIEDARSNPAGTLQALEGKLKEALGLPESSDGIGLELEIEDDSATQGIDVAFLRINLLLDVGFNEGVGIDFDLSSNANPFSLSGGGELQAEGSAQVALNLGIDLVNLGDIYLFEDSGGTDPAQTGIFGDLTLSGDDLGFVASVGLPNAPDLPRLALGIAGGSAAIGGGISVTLDDFFASQDRRLLSEIFDDGGGLADDVAPVVNVEGFVDANLPVEFQGLDLGAITLTAGQEGDPGSFLDFSSILDELQVTLPDFADLIDISQLGLFDSILLGVDGVDIFLSTLQDVLDGDLLNLPLPLIGDQLSDAARFIEDFRDNFVDPFRAAIETAQEFAEDAPTLVAELLFDVLESTGLLLVEVEGELVAATQEGLGTDFELTDAIRIDTNLDMDPSLQESFAQWDFTLGQNLLDLPVDIGLDLGIPGLGIETEGDLEIGLDWQLDLGFGLNFDDGFFFNIAEEDELEFNITAGLSEGTEITGQLAFLQLTAKDMDVDMVAGTTEIRAKFAVDITERDATGEDAERLGFAELGRIQLTPKVGADASAELGLTLGLNEDLVGGSGVFPTVESEFLLKWQLGGGFDSPEAFGNTKLGDVIMNGLADNADDGLQIVAFQEVALDLGSFISDFISPILGQIQEVTGPIQPIVDFVTAPIPVISDLGPEVTLIDLAGVFGKVNPGFIRAIADVITLINAIPTDSEEPIMIPFGDFTIFDRAENVGMDLDLADPNGGGLDGINVADRFSQSNGGKAFNFDDVLEEQEASKTKSFTKQLTGTGGFVFPILTDPSEIFGLLLGREATLFGYDMPALELEFTYKQFFPIFGPLGASIGGTVGATIDFAFGFDTSGIQQFANSGFRNPGLIFNGFFVSDTPEVTGSGPDVAELMLSAGIVATAELNLAVASAGVAGGLFANINFDLFDPDRDGKVRVGELISSIDEQIRFGNPVLAPLAIFDVSGEVFARLFAFLKIDLLFFKVNKEFNILPPITLLEFDIPFSRAPILATELDGGVLQINMGDFAAERLNGDTRDISENFKISGNSGEITVEAFGRSRSYDASGSGFTKILVQAGEGDDVIDLTGLSGSFDLEILGGAGNDRILLDGSFTGQALIQGEAGDDTIVGGAGADRIFGGAGNDSISGGAGADVIFGDDGRIREQAAARELGLRAEQEVTGDGSAALSLMAAGAAKKNLSADAVFSVSIDGGAAVEVTVDRTETDENISLDDLIEDVNAALEDAGLGGSLEAVRDGTFLTLMTTGNATSLSVTSAEIKEAQTSGFDGDDDNIAGGSGEDIIFGGGGDDNIAGDGGDAQIGAGFDPFATDQSAGAADIIVGDVGRIRLEGANILPAETERGLTAGNDEIAGNGGTDVIYGGKGNDEIRGGAGEDRLFGQSGFDTILGGDHADFISGGRDNDIIRAGAGEDLVFGDDGNDQIYGEGDDDTLLSGRGADRVFGGTGDDTLISVVGDDILDGGGGSDTYEMTVQGGPVVRSVTIFDTGAADDGADNARIQVVEALDEAGEPIGRDDTFLLRAANVPDMSLANIDFVADLGLAVLPERAFVALSNSDANLERINYYDNLESLFIDSGAGDDQFFSDDTRALVQISAGKGEDRFQIGQLFRTERDADANIDPFDVFTTTATTVGFLSNGVTSDMIIDGGDDDDTFIVFRNLGNLVLNGDDGDDTFIVQAFALEGSVDDPDRDKTDISVSGGVGADFIQYAVNAPVSIDGGDGFDTVVVIGTELQDDFVITEDGVFGSGLNVNFVGVEQLKVDGSAGDDRFFVQGTGAGFTTEVSGGLGADFFNVGGDAPPITSRDLQGHSGIIDHSVTGGAFTGIEVPGISANVLDNEVPADIQANGEPGIRVIQSEGSTRVSEDGLIDSYFLVLTRPPQPGQNVTITVNPAQQTDDQKRAGKLGVEVVGLPGSQLVFDETNWFIPQEVTLRAQLEATVRNLETGLVETFEDVAEEGLHFANILHQVVGGGFDNAIIPSVKVEIFDKQTPLLIVTESEANTTVLEQQGSARSIDSYEVFLSQQPAPGAPVTVTVTPDDAELLVSLDGVTYAASVELEFTDANHDDPRTIFVKAVDDGDREGLHKASISHSIDVTGETESREGPFVQVDIGDDEAPHVMVVQSNGSTDVTEGGGSFASGDVTVAGNFVDTSSGSPVLRGFVSGSFGSANFVGGSLSITDGTGAGQSSTVIDSIFNSSTLLILDQPWDDGAVPDATSDFTVLGVGLDSYDIFLSAAPEAGETISVEITPALTATSLADPAVQVAVSTDGVNFLAGGLTVDFTTANWADGQTIFVKAIDDAVEDGGNIKQFASQPASLEGIQGPLIIDGFRSEARLDLLNQDPLRLPGELNSQGEVVEIVDETTLVLDNEWQDFRAKDPAKFDAALAEGRLALAISDGVGAGQNPVFITGITEGADSSTFTLAGAFAEAPNDDSGYTVVEISSNFFVDETQSVDIAVINNDGSLADNSGTLTADRLTGLQMGPEGITYRNLENLTINLGSGDDEIDVLGTQNRLDFRTVTILNTGAGNDDVTVDLDGADVPVTVGQAEQSGEQTLVDGDAAFDTTGDGLAGATVKITGGTGEGQVRKILSNTDSELTVVLPWDQIPDSSSTYEIIRQGDGFFALDTQDGDDQIDASTSVLPLVLFGGDGEDRITGGAGDDIIFGDKGLVDFLNEDGRIVTRLGTDAERFEGGATVDAAGGLVFPADPPPNFPVEDRKLADLEIVIFVGEGPDREVFRRTITDNSATGLELDAPLTGLTEGTEVTYRILTVPTDQTDGVFRGVTVAQTRDAANGADDIIDGGDGRDIVFGGNGSDEIDALGTDTVGDIIFGDHGRATFDAAGVPTEVRSIDPGLGGDDEITGGVGPNIVIGGAGGDEILAGGDLSPDVILGDNGLVSLLDGLPREVSTFSPEAGGDDRIVAGDGPNILVGGSGSDEITGGAEAGNVILGDNGTALFSEAGDLIEIFSTVDENGSFGGDDMITAGNGADVIIGGSGGDTILAGGDDAAEDIVLGDNGRATFGGNEAFGPGEETAILSFNFNASHSSRTVTGEAGADGARAGNWINLVGDGPTVYGNEEDEPVIFDDGSAAPGITVEWGADLDEDPDDLSVDAHSQITPGDDQDKRLFEGYLHSRTSETLGVDIAGLGNYFESYDVYVYLDADNGQSRSGNSVRAITDGSTTYYLNDADGNTFTGEYVLVEATDPNLPQAGNYVVFRGLTADVASIRIDDDGTLGNSSANRPAINGLQIVGQRLPIDRIESTLAEDGGDDTIVTGGGADIVIGGSGNDRIDSFGAAVRGAVDADVVVGDSARATFTLGELRAIESIFKDIGGDDEIRTGNGEDLVFGGIGDDTISTGAEGDFDNGEVRVLSFNFNSSVDKGLVTGVAGAVQAGNWNNLISDGQVDDDDDDDDFRRAEFADDVVFDDGSTANDVVIAWGAQIDSSSPRAADRDSQGEIANPDTENERLFEGYLHTTTSRTLGADITGLNTHFASYDVYVYLDADNGKSASGNSVRSITDGTTTYYLDDADGNTFQGEFIEVTSVDPSLPGVGNYVVFRGLTSDTVSIRIDNDTTLSGSSSNRPAIAAIQIVGGADKDGIVIGGDNDRDIAVGDNGLARLLGGTVYEVQTAEDPDDNDSTRPADDTIVTGEGADLVLGGRGMDSVDAGAGHDVLIGDNARVTQFEGEIIDLDRDDLTGNFDPFEVDGIQLLDGIEGGDNLAGGTDDDLAYGQGGNDVYVFAGAGLGKDHLVDNGNDGPGPNDAHDRLDFSAFDAPVSVDLGPFNLFTVNGDRFNGDVNLRLKLSSTTAFEDVTGTAFDDQIFGNARNNTLLGGDGGDSIFGRDGDDLLLGGAGGDLIYGNDGSDLIDGGAGNDLIFGDSSEDDDDDDDDDDSGGRDFILGGDGDDTVRGGGGDDLIDGEAGNDILRGNSGADIILGGAGEDRIRGNSGPDVIEGGDGVDDIQGGDGADQIEEDRGPGLLGLGPAVAAFDAAYDLEGFFFVDPTVADPSEDRPLRAWVDDFLGTVPGNALGLVTAAAPLQAGTVAPANDPAADPASDRTTRVFDEARDDLIRYEELQLLKRFDRDLGQSAFDRTAADRAGGEDWLFLAEDDDRRRPIGEVPPEAAEDALPLEDEGTEEAAPAPLTGGLTKGVASRLVDWDASFGGFAGGDD